MIALTGRAKPRALFLPTASGDADDYVAQFHAGFRALGAETEDLQLLHATTWPRPPAETISRANLIYVGGGSTAGMLALWERFGIIKPLRTAYDKGTVLGGVSAGGLCWFESGVTDSLASVLAPMTCLGWLAGSFCPHYDSEPSRRPTYLRLAHERALPPGYAAEEGVGLLFEDEAFVGAFADAGGGKAFRVGADGEEELSVESL